MIIGNLSLSREFFKSLTYDEAKRYIEKHNLSEPAGLTTSQLLKRLGHRKDRNKGKEGGEI